MVLYTEMITVPTLYHNKDSRDRFLKFNRCTNPRSFHLQIYRHLRFLLRLLSKRMVLYTEMITAPTLYHNEDSRDRFLKFNSPSEHPVVLQLGGSDLVQII